MTIYRAWPDMPTLLGDLMTREWDEVVAATLATEPVEDDPARALAHALVAVTRALRDNEVFVRLLELDPELLLPYLLARRGRSQQAIVELLSAQVGRRPGRGRHPRRRPRHHRPRRWCWPPTASCSRRRRWSTTASSPTTSTPSSRLLRRARTAAMTPAGSPRIRAGLDDLPDRVDLVVAGLGVTGAGVALDAATRGLRGARRRRPRPRLRHLAVVVQAGARRAALPRAREGRRGPRERGRARAPDDDDRAAPDPRRCRCWCRSPRPSRPRRRCHLGRAARGRPAADVGAHTSRAPAPPAAAGLGRRGTLAGPVVRRSGLRGGLVAWDGQLEDDARLVVALARTAAGTAPGCGPGCAWSRRPARASLCATTDRRAAHGPGPRGGQRDRGLGRRAGRGGAAAAEPRHPPGAPRLGAARAAGRADRAGAGRALALRLRGAAARRHALRRAHRRAGRGTGPRRAGADRGRDHLPARRAVGRAGDAADRAPTSPVRTPACGRCSRAPRASPARPPTCRAAMPS